VLAGPPPLASAAAPSPLSPPLALSLGRAAYSLLNSMPSPSKLSEVIKMDLIENRKADEITEVGRT
jgi:hypothetical protein